MAARPRLERGLEPWGLAPPSPAWVDTVWELDFTETEPLDPNIEAQIIENGLQAFTELYESLFPFALQEHQTTESIWTLFPEIHISHNALVALFYHFVQTVHEKNASVQQREYGLHAAGLYFLLLEIPGSVANQVFHPVMFDKCLQTLKKCWPQECSLNRKRKKEQPKSSQGDLRGNRKKGKPPRREDLEMDEIFEEEEEQESDVYFSSRDLSQIREAVFLLLKNFLRLLPKFSLKEKPQCVQNCLQIFVALTSFEPILHELEPSKGRNIPELAYHGLRLLCSPIHGEGDKTIRSLFHQLLFVILMLEGDGATYSAASSVTSQVVKTRNQAIQFISSLVDELKEVVFPVLRILLQHICTKVPDKSEYRTYAAKSLVQLLGKLPCVEYAAFIAWLYRYSFSAKIAYRVFTLDVLLALLEMPERELDSSLPLEQQKFLKHKFLVQVMVFGRCSDKTPTVRSKALTSFAQCLEMSAASSSESILELLQVNYAVSEMESSPESLLTNAEAPSNCPKKTPNDFKTIDVTDIVVNDERTVLDGKLVMAMLRQRAEDEKTNVRKSALQVLMNILKHSKIPCTKEDISMLQDRCRDPAVSVRKQAVQSLTELLMAQHGSVLIQKAWLMGIIPVVLDSETTMQEKALECLDQILLQHIKHYSKFQDEDNSQVLAWTLLTLLTTESQELSRYLNKAFYLWSKKNKFSSTFINNVITHTETEHSAPAWMLLAKVACSSPKLDYTKIIESWERVCGHHNTVCPSTTGHILCVIGHIAKHLPRDTRDRLTGVITSKLREFGWPPEVISPAVEALQKLCHAYAETPEETQVLLNQVCEGLLSTCDRYISNIVLKEGGAGFMEEDLLVRHIFTLGEVAQLCPAKVEKRVFLLIQSILASVDAETMIPTEGSDNLPASQPLSQFKGSFMPPVIRAHAFITLGKLCLQHEDLAKKCIPALVRELEVCQEVAIRNNVMIVLCDLCIRYTVMADRYIPNISVCLRDPSPFIRKQTLILLTNLLQEEFVKWKGSLFFRFVSCLVDLDPDIARFGEFCLVHLLLKRNPVMFFQHFIECIFHFNSYEKHEKYNKFTQSEREKTLFSLKGKPNQDKRMRIYKFLLEHFTDEQRFNITSKISLNILACFVDGVLPLDMEASALLSDTFAVLSSKEIKLMAMRSKVEKDMLEEDEMAMANVVMQEAQKKLISQVQKRNFIENVIPIITSLKTMLEQNKIPALRDLMNYLREVMQDYRDEIKDFFAADKQLAVELEYDMQKFEEQLAQEEQLMEQPSVEGPSNLQDTQQPPPSLETASPSGGQDIPAGAPGARRPPTSAGSSSGLVPPKSSLATMEAVKSLMPRARQMSLSTLAILNSVKKATESSSRRRIKSFGGLSSTFSPGSSKRGSLNSLDQLSIGTRVSVTARAISTPDRTINNVTFGAGVSFISGPHVSSSGKEKTGSTEQRDVLCMSLPDKPIPQPQQWNVTSPARRESNPPSGRKPLRKPPLKSAN
ncbi:condensin-2 complex subunit D3 isoform X1 [Ornithorhynchus anatinus]|uniref:Condensin-2 complex subunit D3 n=1 Tax=Ornithorhynchus anatinus TaxID=9258 RepID=A0A6I8NDI5_ORNAN|nr:condensin-2 complex subunit D3 isoform X1 [Ornithorhynchus anatinus]